MENAYVILDTMAMIALSSLVPMIAITMGVALTESAFASKALQERTVASKPAPMTAMAVVNVWMASVSAMLASRVKTAMC